MRKKHKKPQLCQAVLEKHIGLLSDYLMHPWLSTSKWQNFQSSIEQLVFSLYKYKTYLTNHNKQMKELHKRTTMQPPDEYFSITFILASLKPTEKEYLKIEEVLMTSEYYDQIFE